MDNHGKTMIDHGLAMVVTQGHLKCSAIGTGFNGAETNCGIAHILGILLMNSYKIKMHVCSEATFISSLSPLNYIIPAYIWISHNALLISSHGLDFTYMHYNYDQA